MNTKEKERFNQIKDKYLYFESHGTVDVYEVYDADKGDLVADLSFLISVLNGYTKGHEDYEVYGFSEEDSFSKKMK